MRINGTNGLACKVLMRDVGEKVTLEPILGLPVVKDLIVDMEPFFAQYRSVMPYLINDEEPPDGRERIQSIEERERFVDTTKCILCAACTTGCPSYWANDNFVGPAAIVNAHRFIFDSRDRAGQERLDILNSKTGVWRCRTIYNCTVACPREIQVTRAIGEVKQAILSGETTRLGAGALTGRRRRERTGQARFCRTPGCTTPGGRGALPRSWCTLASGHSQEGARWQHGPKGAGVRGRRSARPRRPRRA